MARCLIAAGHELTVFNRTTSAAYALAEYGARIALSPAETIAADVVITMLADDTAVRDVWLTSGLSLKTLAATIHINMATTSLGIAREIQSMDPRIQILTTGAELSVNRSWEFALKNALELFQFDYLMFFGGDDYFVFDAVFD